LTGRIGVVKVESPTTKDKIGLALEPAPGEVFAELKCGRTPVTLRGGVVVELKANAMT
jgi:hypothetical protein